jgi:putative ABC transport system substrate-binding protein
MTHYFTALFGGAAVAWSLVAYAQQPEMPVIGYLGSGSAELDQGRVRAFRQGLSETGHVGDRDVTIEFRWAALGQSDQLPVLAAELVQRQVGVIVAGAGTRSALALKKATTSIPIVFQIATDPVEAGLVASLSRPGGNITGVTSLNLEVEPKRFELLRDLIPTAKLIAIVVNPTSPFAEAQVKEAHAAAGTLGLQLLVLHASTMGDFDQVFSTMVQQRVDACVISADSFFLNQLHRLAELSVHYKMPTISSYPEFAAAGGLMSYGTDVTDSFRQVGVFTGRILNGEKPADLPVEQATKVTLILNLKTAKALGLAFPRALLGRADEVIE